MRLIIGGRHRRRPGTRRQRGRVRRRRRAAGCSRSPTAWAATAPARSRARPRSRRCAPRSRAAEPLRRRDRRAPTRACPRQVATDDEPARHGHHAHRGHARRPAATRARRPRRRLARVPPARRRAAPGHHRPQPGRGAGRARAGSPRSRPRSTRNDRSSPARSASRTTSRSTCTRSSCVPATGCCSAPTASPTMVRPTPSRPMLRRESDPTRAANHLVDAANAAGGEDNITTIVVDSRGRRRRPVRTPPPPVGPRSTVAAPVALTAASGAEPPPPTAARTATARRRAPAARPGSLLWALADPCSRVLEGATAARRSRRAAGTRARITRGPVRRSLRPLPAADRPDPRPRGRVTPGTRARTSSRSTTRARSRSTRVGPAACWSGTRPSCSTPSSPGALTEDARVRVQDRKTFSDTDDGDRVRQPRGRRPAPRPRRRPPPPTTTTTSRRRPPRAGRRRRPHDDRASGREVADRRRRRSRELGLGLLAVVIVGVRLRAARCSPTGPTLPADLWVFLVAVLGLYVVAHLAVRRFAPRADPTLLPLIAFLLNGIGFVTISRLDRGPRASGCPGGAGPRSASPRSCVTLVRRAPRPHARALHVHVPAARHRRAAAPARPGHRPGDQRRAAVGAHRTAELPARRGREGAARRLLRRVPRRQARAARHGHAADIGRDAPPRSEAPRPAAAARGPSRSW